MVVIPVKNNRNQRAATGPVSQKKSARNRRRRNRQKRKSLEGTFEAMNTPFGNYNLGGKASFKSSVPVAFGRSDSITGPSMQYGSDGSVRIVNREYVTDVISTASGYEVLNTFSANPTSSSAYPWLSTVANSFEKYCYDKLCFHFVTQSPTSAPGSVMLIPDYDVQTNPPSSKAEALSYKDSVRSPPWQESCCVLPKNRLCAYKEYYTQNTPDQRLSNPANLYLATSGAIDSPPISGEIWVEYDIKLTCPKKSTMSFDEFGSNSSSFNHLFQGTFGLYPNDPNPSGSFNTGASYNQNTCSVLLNPGTYMTSASWGVAAGSIIVDYDTGNSVTQNIIDSVAISANQMDLFSLVVIPGSVADRTLTMTAAGSPTEPYTVYWLMTRVQ
jgi:hypothetical protein